MHAGFPLLGRVRIYRIRVRYYSIEDEFFHYEHIGQTLKTEEFTALFKYPSIKLYSMPQL